MQDSMLHTEYVTIVASVCHDANRRYCRALGDYSNQPWDEAPDWQRRSACAGVEFRLNNPGATPKDVHDFWMTAKLTEGWTYGPVKDEAKRMHPYLVEYEQLPQERRIKDKLFYAIVDAFR